MLGEELVRIALGREYNVSVAQRRRAAAKRAVVLDKVAVEIVRLGVADAAGLQRLV